MTERPSALSTTFVMPARNAAPTIAASIESIRDQTVGDWTLVVVDDGSTDETAEIVRGLASRDPRITAVTNRRPRGSSVARNLGALNAKGTWLVFLDADDIIDPDYLAATAKSIQKSPTVDVVYCAGSRMTPDGRTGPSERPPSRDLFHSLADFNPLFISCCRIRRIVFETFGGFDPSLRICEEWDFWQRLARAGVRFEYLDRTLVSYRMSATSLSRDTAEMLNCARQVIWRGHGRDSRVRHPLPAFVEGSRNRPAPEAYAYLVLWCMGLDIGAGKPPLRLLNEARVEPVDAIDSDRAAHTLRLAITVGACRVSDDWAEIAERVRPVIEETLAHLDRRIGIGVSAGILEALYPLADGLTSPSVPAQESITQGTSPQLLVDLSSVRLDPLGGTSRIPPRRPTLRGPSYEDDYDFSTLFFDCFFDVTGNSATLIGPPLLNLEHDLGIAFVTLPDMRPAAWRMTPLTLGTLISVEMPEGSTGIVLQTRDGEHPIAVQPNLSGMFAGRRTAFTLNKDNELQWIIDWAMFSVRVHGANGILVYDNASTRYSVAEIRQALECLGPDIEVAVVPWPFPYGPFDGRGGDTYGIWDSHYCQLGMLEHARRRFLATARSVLNTDVDELVISTDDRSLFEIVENRDLGYLVIDGYWVENAPRPAQGIPRHRDFVQVAQGSESGCFPKWAAVPQRIPNSAQWLVHEISGMPDGAIAPSLSLRHFKAINTNWDRSPGDYAATSISPAPVSVRRTEMFRGDASLVADPVLGEALQRAFGGDDETTPIRPSPRPQPASNVERRRQIDDDKISAPDKESDAWVHWVRGRLATDSGDVEKADIELTKALSLDPGHRYAVFDLASLREGAGDAESAIDLLTDFSSGQPEDPVAPSRLARLLLRLGRTTEALAASNEAIKRATDNADHYLLQSQILRRLGQFDLAAKAVEDGLAAFAAASPDAVRRSTWTLGALTTYHATYHAEGLEALLLSEQAGIKLQQGALPEAEAAIRKAVSRSPFNSDWYLSLAQILDRQERASEAGIARAAALQIARGEYDRPNPSQPGFPWLAVYARDRKQWRADRLARALVVNGHRTEAIEILRESIGLFPASTALRMRLADLLTEDGRSDEAIDVLRGAGAASARAAVSMKLARLKRDTNPEEAIELARSASREQPRNPETIDFLATTLLDSGKLEEVGRVLDDAARRFPTNARFQFLMSRLALAEGATQDAIARARAAVDLSPGTPYLQDHLARLLIDAGDLDDAERLVRGFLASVPAHPQTLFRLSQIMVARGQPDDALAAARQAVVGAPDQAHLQNHYISLLIAQKRWADAEEAANQAVAVAGRSSQILVRISEVKRQQSDLPGAIEALEEALSLDPHAIHVAERLVALYIDADRMDDAGRELDAATLRSGKTAHMSYLKARMLHRSGETLGAIEAARSAVEMDPSRLYLKDFLERLQSGHPDWKQ